jgi:outer membrane receptor protein involved in Fe transport
VYKISTNLEISTGVNCKYGQYILNDISDPDTVWRYSYPLNFESEDPLEDYYNMVDSFSDYRAVMDSIPIYLDPTDSSKIMVNESDPVINSGGIWKYAVYSQMKVTIDRFSVTAGLRYDHVPYNHTSVVAPRIGLSYSITPVTKFNVAYGQYYQSPNYWMLMNPNNEYRLKHT